MSYMFGSRRISSVKLAFKSPYHKRFCFLVYKVNRGRRKRFWNFEPLRSRGHMRKQRLKTLNACISKMAEPTAEWLAPLESAWNFTSETIFYADRDTYGRVGGESSVPRFSPLPPRLSHQQQNSSAIDYFLLLHSLESCKKSFPT